MSALERRKRQSEKRTPHGLSAIAISWFAWRYSNQVGVSLRLAFRRWIMDDAASMAASVSFYLALSLFPLLLLLSSAVGIFLKFTNIGKDAEHQILAIVAEHCSPTLETQIRTLVEQFENQSMLGGEFGLLTALAAAVGVFYQFERAFDKIWRIPPPSKSGIWRAITRLMTQRITAFLLLIAVGTALTAILSANVALGALREWMITFELPGTIAVRLVDATATLGLNAVAFGCLYRWLPKRKVQWHDAMRSGLLVAAIWEVGRQFLSAVLIGVRYTTAYGAIGSFIAILLWFYWGVTILFFGAEYVQVLSRRHQKPLTMFDPWMSDEAIEEYTTPEPVVPKTVPRRAA